MSAEIQNEPFDEATRYQNRELDDPLGGGDTVYATDPELGGARLESNGQAATVDDLLDSFREL